MSGVDFRFARLLPENAASGALVLAGQAYESRTINGTMCTLKLKDSEQTVVGRFGNGS